MFHLFLESNGFMRISFLVLFLGILSNCGSPQEVRLMVYVGSGMKEPMYEIKRLYETKNPHITIDYSFSGSKILEQTIRSLKQGDGFMPGDKKYINALEQDGMIIVKYPIALHIPSVVILKENTTITSWEDLAQEGVRLCIPNPEMASIGKTANIILERSPLGQQIRARVTTLAADTDETVKLLLDKQVDAAISWDSMVIVAPDKLKLIDIPAEINEIEEIWIAVPTFTVAKDEAIAFAQFIASSNGLHVFKEKGFPLIEGR